MSRVTLGRYTSIDSGKNLQQEDGKIDEKFFADGLQLNNDGYSRIVDEIIE